MTTQEKIDFVKRAMDQMRVQDLWHISSQHDNPRQKTEHDRYEKKWREVMDWLEGKFPPF